MPYRPTRFNAIVGLDIKSIRDASGQEWKFLNVLDLATAFNLVHVLKLDHSSQDVAQVFNDGWVRWAGLPEKMVVDRGGEFQGQFGQMADSMGISVRVIPTESPWQLGMVEPMEV